ncbi:hypothetical protein GUJ93_ZPchr0013g34101 [Zizania palustris]|uniref:Uncharacterized protein n=1 Tax=Zizania palustris TaxID=103762 RepID=A0A8J5X1C6_ZIZPA|nr:hypothetical protein GUJ93_ZPchr0013g34101 [Zizania palustris]
MSGSAQQTTAELLVIVVGPFHSNRRPMHFPRTAPSAGARVVDTERHALFWWAQAERWRTEVASVAFWWSGGRGADIKDFEARKVALFSIWRASFSVNPRLHSMLSSSLLGFHRSGRNLRIRALAS